MSTPAEQVCAQQGACDFSGREGRNLIWSRHIIGPLALNRLIADAATLDRIRAYFQHGADEEAWPPGTPLDEVVVKIAEDDRRRRRLHRLVSRRSFEAWISAPPYEHEVLRYPEDETKYAWQGQYRNIAVQLAWEAWCESANS